MEYITPLLSTIALWVCLCGCIIFGASMAYVGILSFISGYTNSDNWRRVAADLEKECQCLHRQLEAMTKTKKKTAGAKS
jgi:hypothetical protein